MKLCGNSLLAFAFLLAANNAWSSHVACELPWHDFGQDRLDDIREWRHDKIIPTAKDDDKVVFETTKLFKNRTSFTEIFHIETAGTYQAILTDFEFPTPLKKLAINISTATQSLAKLLEPGNITFEAEPGEYYLSLFANAGRGNKPKEHYNDEWMPWERHGHRGYGGLGQYGVEISMTTSVVPVPAAIWLFTSGLIGLTGLSLRRHSATLFRQ